MAGEFDIEQLTTKLADEFRIEKLTKKLDKIETVLQKILEKESYIELDTASKNRTKASHDRWIKEHAVFDRYNNLRTQHQKVMELALFTAALDMKLKGYPDEYAVLKEEGNMQLLLQVQETEWQMFMNESNIKRSAVEWELQEARVLNMRGRYNKDDPEYQEEVDTN